MERSPEEEREQTLANLERERDLWLGLKTRVERTGGRDAQLSLHYEASNDRMNRLLENYFGQLLMQEAFENVPVAE